MMGNILGKNKGLKLPFFEIGGMKFSDVAGLNDLKKTLKKEVIYPIKHPKLSKLYKQRIGSGVLLYGPPGCGKTFMIKAIAGEIGWPYINASCGNIIARYAGQTENNLHRVFEAARGYVKTKGPGVILFLDEIDALGHRRDEISSGSLDLRIVVNTLLTELDGMSSNDKVFVIGATNAPWSVDPALKRPGRFDNVIFVTPPDQETRVELFNLYTKGLPMAKDIDLKTLASKTRNYSSVDIREICDAAAEMPWEEAIATNKARRIKMADFEKVLENSRSSLTEWYEMVYQKGYYEQYKDIFPELASSVEEFFYEDSSEDEKGLIGYG